MRLVAALAAVACGCAPGEVHGSGGRTQHIVLDVSRIALSQLDITRVDLTISGPGIAAPIVTPLERGAGAVWSGSVNGIPAGAARLFRADAFDGAGAIVYQGQALADVPAGATLSLSLVLQDPPPSPEDGLPALSVELERDQVSPSTPVSVRAVTSGADAAALTFAWDARCPGSTETGSFADPGSSSTTWTSPAAQPLSCVLSIRVGNAQGSSVTVYVAVQVAG